MTSPESSRSSEEHLKDCPAYGAVSIARRKAGFSSHVHDIYPESKSPRVSRVTSGGSYAVTASLPDSLGAFWKLPGEVRRMIWRYFKPENQTCFGTCTWETSLAILRTGKQIHDEVTAELYHNRRLRLFISPTEEAVIVKDLPRAHRRSFGLANFTRFRSISIDIEPADSEDPGQLFRMRDLAKTVVSALSTVARLPKITITLLETETNSWYEDFEDYAFTDTHAKYSAPSIMDHALPADCDMGIMLNTFRFLRGARSVVIIRPYQEITRTSQVMTDDWLRELTKSLTTSMISRRAFGTPKTKDEEDDKQILCDERVTTIMLDYDLDGLEGETAAWLRLQRYKNFLNYFSKMYRLLGKQNELDKDTRKKVARALENRIEGYIMWNQELESHADGESNLEYNPEHPWELWYPGGIPPDDSKAWWRQQDRYEENVWATAWEFKDTYRSQLYEDGPRFERLWDLELEGE